jgi:hypothetical protein
MKPKVLEDGHLLYLAFSHVVRMTDCFQLVRFLFPSLPPPPSSIRSTVPVVGKGTVGPLRQAVPVSKRPPLPPELKTASTEKRKRKAIRRCPCVTIDYTHSHRNTHHSNKKKKSSDNVWLQCLIIGKQPVHLHNVHHRHEERSQLTLSRSPYFLFIQHEVEQDSSAASSASPGTPDHLPTQTTPTWWSCSVRTHLIHRGPTTVAIVRMVVVDGCCRRRSPPASAAAAVRAAGTARSGSVGPP